MCIGWLLLINETCMFLPCNWQRPARDSAGRSCHGPPVQLHCLPTPLFSITSVLLHTKMSAVKKILRQTEEGDEVKWWGYVWISGKRQIHSHLFSTFDENLSNRLSFNCFLVAFALNVFDVRCLSRQKHKVWMWSENTPLHQWLWSQCFLVTSLSQVEYVHDLWSNEWFSLLRRFQVNL